jgi:hypothetical protein
MEAVVTWRSSPGVPGFISGATQMRNRILVLAMILLLAASALQATTLIPMFLDDLTAASQTVVYGKVIGSRTEWDAGHKWIYTIYTIQSSEYLKGSLGPSFELTIPGGERDGVELIVEGAARLESGQEAVLFVWTGPDGKHQVTGFEQGAVPVATDPSSGAKVAARGLALGTAALERSVLSAASVPRFTSRVLPQMLQQIRASVASTRAAAQRSGGAR